jgi:iron complex outermembrane recepter protein
VRGVELELRARPVDALDINAAVGYTDFDITELDPSVTDVTLDTHMVNTPEWTANAGIQYTWPAGASGEVRVRGDWVYQDTSYIDILNTPALKRDAHSIFNARVTWVLSSALMGGGWELAAFGTNLADERVLANGISALDSFGTVEGFYNRPREWGITVRKSF